MVAQHAVHGLAQGGGHLAQAGKGLLAAVHLGDIQAQGDVADGGLVGVFGQRGLRVVAQRQHGRQARGTGGQHQPAGHGAHHKAHARGILLHVAGAPGRMAGAQHERQLRIVVAGELIEFAGAGHFLQHVGKIGRRIDGVGKRLGLDHKLRKLDLVERARAVGQLHAGLKALVALAGRGGLPLLRHLVETLDGKGLAARAARGRQRRQCGVARHRLLGLQRGDDVDQRVQPQTALVQQGRHGQLHGIVGIHRVAGGLGAAVQAVKGSAIHGLGYIGIERGLLAQRGLGSALGLLRHGALGRVAARGPGVVGHDQGQHQAADDGQTQLQCAHKKYSWLSVALHTPSRA